MWAHKEAYPIPRLVIASITAVLIPVGPWYVEVLISEVSSVSCKSPLVEEPVIRVLLVCGTESKRAPRWITLLILCSSARSAINEENVFQRKLGSTPFNKMIPSDGSLGLFQ